MKELTANELERLSANDVNVDKLHAAVKLMLIAVGEDPNREGLRDTPTRVISSLLEMTEGYHQDPKEILSTTFEETGGIPDAVVALDNIPFVSQCEHHMLVFSGVAHIGYLPKTRIVGLSKLARIVDVYAKRLQVQERMGQQIATAINDELQPLGVAVIIKGKHSCMACRGIRKHGTTMTTSCMLGAFMEEGNLRAEFLELIKS